MSPSRSASARSALLVNATELLRVAGTRKHVNVAVTPSLLDAVDAAIVGDITVDVELESTLDDVSLAGTLFVPWHGQCRRCLRAVSEMLSIAVEERYADETSGRRDAFAIEHGQIDLAPMVRENVLLAVDDPRLCRPDCPGLCPRCGADLATNACTCATAERDDRWSVLDQIREP